MFSPPAEGGRKEPAKGAAPAPRRLPLRAGPRLSAAPAVPQKILATLHEDWTAFDPEADRLLGWIRSVHAFHEFAHARDPFHVHLRGTWQILSCWDQPQDICRCGLLHSAYSRSGFNFRFFDIHSPDSRENLRSLLGKGAEQLIYNYCSTWDEQAWFPVASGERKPARLEPEGYEIPSRLSPGETLHLSAEDMAKLLVILVADLADQHSERYTYRDVYHQEEPELNWPGPGAPGIGALPMFSRMLAAAKPYLEVVPPVFEGCTAILDFKDESTARDLYWKTMQEEEKMKGEEREAAYTRVCELNPFVAEPHVMLSQELYRRGDFVLAVHEAATALEIFYQWGTCWDKRHSFAQWVGFARMMLLRSKRRQAGELSLPSKKVMEFEEKDLAGEPPAFDPQTRVTFLQDVLKGFRESSAPVRSKL